MFPPDPNEVTGAWRWYERRFTLIQYNKGSGIKATGKYSTVFPHEGSFRVRVKRFEMLIMSDMIASH